MMLRVLAVALMCVVCLAPATQADPPRGKPVAVLEGDVLNDADGSPVAGAHVVIWSAAPIEGPAYYCPTCYRDCGRSATTDQTGRFVIDGLDDTLKFRLVVTSDGYAPFLTPRLQDPRLGPNVGEKAIRLRARDWSRFTPAQVLTGQVVDERGEPLPRAIIEPFGIATADDRGAWGAVDGLDRLAVTDAEGRFRVAYFQAARTISVVATARGMARGVFAGLATGNADHRLRLVEGAAVVGRLVRDGRPVEGVEVAVYTTRRSVIDDQPHEERIATGEDGGFMLANLRPDADLWFYTKMASAKRVGAAELRQIKSGASGSTLDLGEVAMGSGFLVAGQLEMNGGGPVPKGRVFLSSNLAWDDQIVEVSGAGAFRFESVPAGSYSLTYVGEDRDAQVWVSPRNASFPFPGADRLTGRIDGDKTDLRVLLAVRDPQREMRHRAQPWERSLEGAENAPELEGTAAPSAIGDRAPTDPNRLVRLSELDVEIVDDSGNPVAGAIVRVAYCGVRISLANANFQPDGVSQFHVTDAAGRTICPSLGGAESVLIGASARGFTSASMMFNCTQAAPARLVVTRRDPASLAPSAAIRGRVVDATGQPVVDALVACTAVVLDVEGRSRLQSPGKGEPHTLTDADGRFVLALSPENQGVDLRVSAQTWAPARFIRQRGGPEEQQYRLERGSSIHGRVVREGSPVPDASVTIVQAWPGRESGSVPERSTTDAQGRFRFDHLQGGTSWTITARDAPGGLAARVDRAALANGETADVGDITLQPGLRLAGRFVAAGGAGLPLRTVTIVGLHTGEVHRAPVRTDGTFEAVGLTPGSYNVEPEVEGGAWQLATANAALPWRQARILQGRLDGDKTDLVMMFEPWSQQLVDPSPAESRPLRGIEPVRAIKN